MRPLIITTLLFISSFVCFSQEAEQDYKFPKFGYKGEASLALGFSFAQHRTIPIIDIATLHGYQCGKIFFIGIGISTINTQFLDIYGEVRTNLLKPSIKHKSYPYLGFKVGYTWSTWIGEKFGDEKGVVLEPKLGCSIYSKLAKLRYNVFSSVEILSFSLYPKIGIAFEF